MAKILGQVTIRKSGVPWKTFGGASLDPGGIKRETKTGDGWVAPVESTVQSKIECEVQITQGVSLADFVFGDETVTFTGDTGQTWIVNHAWTTDTPQLTGGEGKAKIVIEGPPAEEML